LRQLRGNFFAQNSIWRPAFNPTGRFHPETYIIVSGMNILLWVSALRKKKGSNLAFFEAVEGRLFCSKFNLEAGLKSYKEIAPRKIYLSGA
jgi:hypothetical protein